LIVDSMVISETGLFRRKAQHREAHLIAGVRFLSESDERLPRLWAHPFSLFRAPIPQVDVVNRFWRVNRTDQGSSASDGEWDELLTRGLHATYRARGGRLAGIPELVSWLRHTLVPGAVHAWMDADQLVVRDFQHCRIDYLYSDHLGYEKHPHEAEIAEKTVAASLRSLFATFLPVFDGLAIHSSGVVLRERAVLFLGTDGGGKSTVVQQAEGLPVLNDDHVVVRKEGSTILAHATPLSVLTDGPASASVGLLLVLRKGQRFSLHPANRIHLLECLLAEHEKYTFFLPVSLKQRAFNLLADLCLRTPSYIMEFEKDHVDWAALSDLL